MIDISVISVTKDNLEGLKRTWASLISQDINLDAIEWIVKDGVSRDGTIEFLKEVEQKGILKNFRWVSGPDQSLYDAMNIAMSMMSGRYVQFLNAGDYYHSVNVLSRTIAIMDEYDYENAPTFFYGDDLVENIDGNFVLRRARDIGYLWHSLPCSHQAIFYNTAHIGDVRYNVKYRICADYQFTYEIYKTNYHGYRLLNYIVPIFVAGGHALQQRLKLCQEAYDIKKEISDIPMIMRSFSFAAGYANNVMMHHIPRLYNMHRRLMDRFISNPK